MTAWDFMELGCLVADRGFWLWSIRPDLIALSRYEWIYVHGRTWTSVAGSTYVLGTSKFDMASRLNGLVERGLMAPGHLEAALVADKVRKYAP